MLQNKAPNKNESETFALSDVMLIMTLTIDDSAFEFEIILRLLTFSARESAALSNFGNCHTTF